MFPIHSHLTRLVIHPFFGEQAMLNDCFEMIPRLGHAQPIEQPGIVNERMLRFLLHDPYRTPLVDDEESLIR